MALCISIALYLSSTNLICYVLFFFKVNEELSRWGLQFNDDLVKVQGRVVQRDKIMFGGRQHVDVSERADWDAAFRSK